MDKDEASPVQDSPARVGQRESVDTFRIDSSEKKSPEEVPAPEVYSAESLAHEAETRYLENQLDHLTAQLKCIYDAEATKYKFV